MKILFVCHGNICRSPMAEFVMKDMLAKAGRGDVAVESAALLKEVRRLSRHRCPRGRDLLELQVYGQ
jgi:protein-tyrosine-phosphatase